MNRRKLNYRDYELISIYIDGQFTNQEKIEFENRLNNESDLLKGMVGIRQTKAMLRSLPDVKIPHNFILTKAMIGKKENTRWFSLMAFSSAFAGLLLVASIMFSMLFPAIGNGSRTAKLSADIPETAVSMPSAEMKEGPEEPPMIIQWGGPLAQGGAMGMGGGYGGGGSEGMSQPAMPLIDDPGAYKEETTVVLEDVTVELSEDNDAEKSPEESTSESSIALESETAGGGIEESQVILPFATSLPPDSPVSNEGGGPILGIPSSEEAGQIKQPELKTTKEPVHIANKLAGVRIIQISLAIFTLIAGIIAYILKRKKYE